MVTRIARNTHDTHPPYSVGIWKPAFFGGGGWAAFGGGLGHVHVINPHLYISPRGKFFTLFKETSLKTKPLAIFELHVPKQHKLVVYMWGTLREMRQIIRKLPGASYNQKDTLAFFHAPNTEIGAGCVVRNRVVGEIHLVKGYFGAGIFAHELQHFISWWSDIKDYEPLGKDWERIPTLVGKITTQFWKKYYKVFD